MTPPGDALVADRPPVPYLTDALAGAQDRVAVALWAGFLIFFPFYVFPSGLPQPADFMLLAGVVIVFIGAGFRFRIHRRAVDSVAAFVGFALYTVLVAGAWYVVTEDGLVLRFPLYYVYNTLLFLGVVALYRRLGTRWVRATVYATAASILLQVALMPVSLNLGSFRQPLFFNNPNQLGYYGVLVATIFGAGTRLVRVPAALQVAVFLSAALLTALSLSKSAVVSFAVLVVVLFAHRPLALLLGSLVAGAVAWVFRDAVPLVANLGSRLADIGGQADDTFAGRGYDRILNHPEVLLFGAGEGAVSRFETSVAAELHSSWGTLLFSYGIVGTLLFLAGLWFAVRSGGPRWALLLAPAALYGLTHQGLRFSLLWVLVGVLLCGGIHLARRGRFARRPARQTLR